MFDILGGLIDGIFGFTEEAINGVLNASEDVVNGAIGASEHVVNGIMGATEAVIDGTVEAGSAVIDATVKIGLPIVKTAGELYLGGIISPALGAIPGPVGVIANVYDAADTIRGTFTAVPDTIGEIEHNFEDTSYQPQKYCDRCGRQQGYLLEREGRKLCSECFGEEITQNTYTPSHVSFESTYNYSASSDDESSEEPVYTHGIYKMNMKRCSRCRTETLVLFSRAGVELCGSCYTSALTRLSGFGTEDTEEDL